MASEAALIRISMHFSWARRDGAGQSVRQTGSSKKGTPFGSHPLLTRFFGSRSQAAMSMSTLRVQQEGGSGVAQPVNALPCCKARLIR